jgi:hypothetical protein
MATKIECTKYVENTEKYSEACEKGAIDWPEDLNAADEAFRHAEFGFDADWFEELAYAEAQQAKTLKAADTILRNAYKGADAYGIGLKWKLSEAV